MIFLTKGQPLFDNPGLVVCDPTGYYNDGDSVACAPYHMPEEPIYRYEAKFIVFGGMVYEITDEEKLLEEVKKLNPETLFGKNKEEVAIDKIVENIVVQDTSEKKIEEPTVEEVTLPSTVDTSTTTPPVIDPGTPPSTSPVIDSGISTTTPPVFETPLATTTPSIDISTNTSTPPVIDIGVGSSTPGASLTDH